MDARKNFSLTIGTLGLFALCITGKVGATSYTWLGNDSNRELFSADNWEPFGTPRSPADVGKFRSPGQFSPQLTSISGFEPSYFLFEVGSGTPFNFDIKGVLTFTGVIPLASGVNNASSAPQTFHVHPGGSILFQNASSGNHGGNHDVYYNVVGDGTPDSSSIIFSGASTGGRAVYNVEKGGLLSFEGLSTGDAASVAIRSGSALKTSHPLSLYSLSVEGAESHLDILGTLTLGDDNRDHTIQGYIQNNLGAGSLFKEGSGTLTLETTAHESTYSGGTTFSQGTIRIGSSLNNLGSGPLTFTGGTLQWGVGGITQSNPIVINSTGTIETEREIITMEGSLSGAGATLKKSGIGTLVLTGSNSSWAGAIEVEQGSLTGRGDQSLPQLTVLHNTLLNLEAPSGAAQFSSVISGSGEVVAQEGAVILSGNNTYSGTTKVTKGSLEFTGDVSGMDSSLHIDRGAAADFEASGPESFKGVISGRGELNVNQFGAIGTLQLLADNTLSGPITVDNGTLQLLGSVAGLTGNLAIHSGATTDIEATSNETFVGTISGNGHFNFNQLGASGELLLSGKSTFAGTTSLYKGKLQFTGNVSEWTGPITTAAGTSIDFEARSSETFSGAITGLGNLEVNRHGATETLSLTALNSYTGTTELWGGVLQVGSGANIGLGNLIFNGGTLRFTQPVASAAQNMVIQAVGGTVDTLGNSIGLSGSMSGASTGVLTKIGVGELTLTNTLNHMWGGTLSIKEGTVLVTSGDCLPAHVLTARDLKLEAPGVSTVPYSTLISGSGGVEVNTLPGSLGTVVLTNQNTYSGSTTIHQGTLEFTGNVSSLAGPLHILSSAITDFEAPPGVETFHGAISGGGELDVNVNGATGTLILSGTNNLAGPTVVAGGALEYTGNISGATGSLSIAPLASVDFEISSSETFKGSILGSGSLFLNQHGTKGALTLSGNNSAFTGSLTLNRGELQVADGTNVGSPLSQVHFTGGATLAVTGSNAVIPQNISFNSVTGRIQTDGNTVTLSGNLSGSSKGSLEKIGLGTLILMGPLNSAWNGSLRINRGKVMVSAGTALPGKVHIGSRGILDLESPSPTTTYNSLISGIADLIVNSNPSHLGTVILTANNTYGGLTKVEHGGLEFTGNVSEMKGQLSLASGTFVDFEAVGKETFHGAISGKGQLFVNQFGAGGTLVLPADNTYSGTTRVFNGELELTGDLSNLGGRLVIDPTASVTFEPTISTIFKQTISGSGPIFKTGKRTLTLSGNSAGYAGTISVDQGGFRLSNNAIGGNLLIHDGGTLLGTGTIGGQLSIEGGGVYKPQVDIQQHSNLITANQTATLEQGSELVIKSRGVDLDFTYTILHSDIARNGRFSSVHSTNPTVTPLITYTSQDVLVKFDLNFNSIPETFNQKQVAHQLKPSANLGPKLKKILNTLTRLPVQKFRRVLDQMSAQQYTNLLLTAEFANHQFVKLLYNPLRSLVNTPCLSKEASFDLWVQSGAGHLLAKGNKNSNGFVIDNYAMSAGIQKQIASDWTLGVAGDFERDNLMFKVGGIDKRENYLSSLYALYRPQGFYVLGDLIVGYNHNRISRPIDLKFIEYNLKSRPRVFQSTVYIESGRDFGNQTLLVQPFVGLEAGYFYHGAISEEGNHPLGIYINTHSYDSVQGNVGFHCTYAKPTFYNFKMGLDGAFRLRTTPLNNHNKQQFQLFGSSYKILGFQVQRYNLEGDLFFSVQPLDCLEAYLQVGGSLWRRASSYNVLGGLQASW